MIELLSLCSAVYFQGILLGKDKFSYLFILNESSAMPLNQISLKAMIFL